MGYLVKRIFLNKNIKNDHFLDICITHRNQQLLWYCCKSDHKGMFGICMDEKAQESFFERIGTDCDPEDFEEKVQLYFKKYEPENYYQALRDSLGDNAVVGNIPHNIKFDREADPHVVLCDGTTAFSEFSFSEDKCEHFLFEMIMNAVEEFQIGEATEITVNVKGDTYEIIDDGSGIGVEDSELLKDYEWKRIMMYPGIIFKYPDMFPDPDEANLDNFMLSKYYDSGFYKKTPKYSYNHSYPKKTAMPMGTIAHAQVFSSATNITTIRNSKKYSFQFKNGYCISGRTIQDANVGEKGTHIVWTPDSCCFCNVKIPFNHIATFLEQQAFLNPGLKISFDYDGEKYDYYFSNGMSDYLESKIENPIMPIIKTKFSFVTEYSETSKNEEELEFVMGIVSNGFLESYHNYRKLKYGVTVNNIYEQITEKINEYIHTSRFSYEYKEYEKLNVSVEDVKKHFCVVISSLSEYSFYSNEACKGLSDVFFEAAIKKTIISSINQIFNDWNPDEDELEKAKEIIDMIIESK